MLAFAKMLLKMKAFIRTIKFKYRTSCKRIKFRIPAESAQSAASLGHHFFQLRQF